MCCHRESGRARPPSFPPRVTGTRFRRGARSPPGEEPLEEDEQLPVSFRDELSAKRRRDAVQLAGGQPIEQRPIRTNDAISCPAAVRNGHVAPLPPDVPAVDRPPLRELEPKGPRRLTQPRLLPALSPIPQALAPPGRA